MDLSFLPSLNASLNALTTVLLLAGRALARRRRVDAHRRVMISAFAISALFLASYLAHKLASGFESRSLQAEGAPRLAYLSLLVSHSLLAAAVPFLAIALIRLGLRGRVEAHRRLARLAWPIWMYVSLSGVAVYVVLYHLNPAPEPVSRAPLVRVGSSSPGAGPSSEAGLPGSGELPWRPPRAALSYGSSTVFPARRP